MHGVDKGHLPEKCCPVCQRAFRWRKRWARDWQEVKYCSERCRRQRRGGVLATPHTEQRHD